jgi:hypothetical protein
MFPKKPTYNIEVGNCVKPDGSPGVEDTEDKKATGSQLP